MSILLYGLDVCCLNKTELNSLDFVINRFCMKLFSTSNMDIIKDCQSYLNLKLPSELLTKRYDKFFIEIVYHKQCILCGFHLNFADAVRVLLMFILFSFFLFFSSIARDE